MKVVNLNNNRLIGGNIRQAYSFFKRLRGLMFTSGLPKGSGLHLHPCNSVHTFFMNYPIDVLYVNDQNVVVAVDEALPPGKVGKVYKDAVSVVELSAGTVKETATRIGHKINFIQQGEMSNDE
ncbi:MAG TPA: DUF192 domain-containing protein [Chondromyces sp.]|nr:DUF192 domain-containing protein [Chondromyces sp.]